MNIPNGISTRHLLEFPEVDMKIVRAVDSRKLFPPKKTGINMPPISKSQASRMRGNRPGLLHRSNQRASGNRAALCKTERFMNRVLLMR